MKKRNQLLLLGLALSSVVGAHAYASEDKAVHDKVIAGYQAWFNTEGDGSPKNSWVHWGQPEAGKLTFEAYPDVRDYPESVLKETRFSKLGNGETSKLFSSYPAETIDKHFEIMKEYGIDGVAVQKFGSNTVIGKETNQQNFNAILQNIRTSAEKHDRLFYIMYDISGLSEENIVEALTRDWQEVMVEEMDITSSPAYAKEGDRAVVCLWGLGIRSGTPQQYCEIIDWFHEKGCYVIGGVPKGWLDKIKTDPELEKAFCKLDMLSPWAVGSMKTDEDVDSNAQINIAADKAYLDEKGIVYQPVMFPGFAWSNWKTDSVRNQIPRRAGDFMWRQAYNIAKQGIGCGYVAMFDEYDEGTAILKLAEDSSMVPKDQYFLTASADGVYTSSDLYLRLTAHISKVLRGEVELTEEMPIPLSEGPVYYRSGFEKGLDAMPVSEETEVVKDEVSYNGRYSIELTDKGTYTIAKLDLKNKNSMYIGANAYLANGNVSVKIGYKTADGTMIDGAVALEKGKWMHSDIETDITGKEITELVVTVEGDGEYKLYLDDITVTKDKSLINKNAPDTKYDLYARSLYDLGLLDGESKERFEMHLENAVTREQAVKAIMGVLGEKADENTTVPFEDLSDWAVPYIAKAYEKGLVKGVSGNLFNASGIITKREATAVFLRALGAEGDTYTDCERIAVETGFYNDESLCTDMEKPLTYDELVFLSYRALFTAPVGNDGVLLGKHLQNGVFTNSVLEKEIDVIEEYNATLKPPARVIFNTDYFYNLMNIAINNDPTKGDSYTEAAIKNDEPCILVPEKQFMYCQISDGYISTEDNKVKVTVTYLDEGNEIFGFHYNSNDTSLEGNARNYKAYNFEARTNTGEWKTQSAIIEDAAFNNKQNSGADMRIFGPNVHIKEISVEKID